MQARRDITDRDKSSKMPVSSVRGKLHKYAKPELIKIEQELGRELAMKDKSDQDAIALAGRRDKQIENGEVTPLSHKELMDRLRK